MISSLATFVISLALVVFGAQWLVTGSTDLAKRLKVPNIFIGFTVVAFGTSLPELSVILFAATKGEVDLALGNIIGSNITNIGLVIGISALIAPLLVKSSTIRREMPLMFIALFVATVLAADKLFNGAVENVLQRSDGIILLTLFTIFVLTMIFVMLSVRKSNVATPKYGLFIQLMYIIGGFIGLIYGGQYVVSSALELADFWDLSKTFTGIVILGIGTSLPELATSIIAVLKKQADIAVGNIVGSNLFNTAFILGLASTINPTTVTDEILLDMVLMTLFGIMLFVMVLGKDKKIVRAEGAFLLLAFISYIALLFIRG